LIEKRLRKLLEPKTRQLLIDAFSDEICELSSILGRDLSHWLKKRITNFLEHKVPESTNYREWIYKDYASRFQDAKPTFDVKAADRWGHSTTKHLRNWLPKDKNSKILELACGGGKLLHLLKKKGYTNLNGVDISPEQVSLSKQVTENIIEANVLDFLKTETEKYDLVIGMDIIEHFEKEEAVEFLKACLKTLKPDGRIILQTPNSESPWSGSIRYGDFTHEICFSPNCLARVLKLIGFDKIELRETGPVIHGFKSLLRCIAWKFIRLCLKIWNLAETGGTGSGVFTRTFLASGTVASTENDLINK